MLNAGQSRPWVYAFAACWTFATAHAQQPQQPEVMQAPDLVVVGTRLPETAAGMAQSITIIDAKQLESNRPISVQDILNRAPGIYTDQVGAGGFSSLYVRGAEQSHLLILIDGVKVNDPTTTRGSAYDLSAIDPSTIEQIEVLRGPASAVHGPEALGGVINVITKKRPKQGLHGTGYVGVGTDDYGKAGGNLSFGSEQWGGNVGVGYVKEGGLAGTEQELNTYSLGLSATPNDWIKASFIARRSERDAKAFPDDSGGPLFAVLRDLEQRDSEDTILGANVAVGRLDVAQVQLLLSRFERDEQVNSPGIDPFTVLPPNTSDTDFRRDSAAFIVGRSFGERLDLLIGAEHQKETGRSHTEIPFFGALDFDLTRKTRSLFAEGRLHFTPALSAQLGVRRDKVEGFSRETTPHLGLVWDLPWWPRTALKASYSKGFKPPSFFALGNPFVGNPNLRPERSINREFIFQHDAQSGGWGVQASIFNVSYSDLVLFDPAISPVVTNFGALRARGIEPSIYARLHPKLMARASVTNMDLDSSVGTIPRNRPERKASLSLEYQHDERWSTFGVVNHVGKFRDISQATPDQILGDYTTLDLSIAAKFQPVTLTFAIDNAFDKDYQQFIGFPSIGRRLRFDLRAEF